MFLNILAKFISILFLFTGVFLGVYGILTFLLRAINTQWSRRILHRMNICKIPSYENMALSREACILYMLFGILFIFLTFRHFFKYLWGIF